MNLKKTIMLLKKNNEEISQTKVQTQKTHILLIIRALPLNPQKHPV